MEDTLARGYVLIQEGHVSRGRHAYFSREDFPGSIIELADFTPERQRVSDGIRQAARDWDGANPIRTVWPS
jgi:hypothetical protein